MGKIDDIVFDHSTGHIYYVVVDTGGWLSSNKFIVPPEALRPAVDHEGDFRVDLTQDQIESLPPYNESDLESEEKWADYNGRYRSAVGSETDHAPRGHGPQYHSHDAAAD